MKYRSVVGQFSGKIGLLCATIHQIWLLNVHLRNTYVRMYIWHETKGSCRAILWQNRSLLCHDPLIFSDTCSRPEKCIRENTYLTWNTGVFVEIQGSCRAVLQKSRALLRNEPLIFSNTCSPPAKCIRENIYLTWNTEVFAEIQGSCRAFPRKYTSLLRNEPLIFFDTCSPPEECIRENTDLMERWGAGVETQKNVREEIGGWGRVPFNETYAPSLSTVYDGA